MTDDKSASVSDQQAVSESESDLLLEAVKVLRRRYEEGGRYAELPPFAAAQLGDRLAGVATTQQAGASAGVDRDEALALAHRLIDDDHPELSSIWPDSTG